HATLNERAFDAPLSRGRDRGRVRDGPFFGMKSGRMDRPAWARAAILVLFFAAAAALDLVLASVLAPVLPGALVLAILLVILLGTLGLAHRWGR
ncbi:MAG TPA: hypothetical protein VEY12_06695, partial [Thermoplasmata archaeon]|nr:hypothetical protein [Thermoplasmata archaeon]